MAMSVTYTNFVGAIAYENRGGTESYYAPDTLGSTAMLLSSTGVVTDTWIYWPFGEVQARTGTTETPFTFVGTLGYFQDILNNLTYVRARYLRLALARWQTVDRYWPTTRPYNYAGQRPVSLADPSGNEFIGAGIGCAIGGLAGGFVSYFDQQSPAKIACIAAADCAAGAIVGALGTEDPGILNCVFGALGGEVQKLLEQLCDRITGDGPARCSSGAGDGGGPGGGGDGGSGGDGPGSLCADLSTIVGGLVGCLGFGTELEDYVTSIVMALMGAECSPIGKKIVPG